MRYGCYTLQAPHRTKKQGKCQPVTLHVVEAKEINPKGEAICWRLLSSLPIDSLADAKMLLRYYTYRWRIERLHYILKRGAKIEELQLATPEQLQKAITLLSIVSAHFVTTDALRPGASRIKHQPVEHRPTRMAGLTSLSAKRQDGQNRKQSPLGRTMDTLAHCTGRLQSQQASTFARRETPMDGPA